MAVRRQGQRMLSLLRQRATVPYRSQFGGTSRMFSDNASATPKRPGALAWLVAGAIGFTLPIAYHMYESVCYNPHKQKFDR